MNFCLCVLRLYLLVADVYTIGNAMSVSLVLTLLPTGTFNTKVLLSSSMVKVLHECNVTIILESGKRRSLDVTKSLHTPFLASEL